MQNNQKNTNYDYDNFVNQNNPYIKKNLSGIEEFRSIINKTNYDDFVNDDKNILNIKNIFKERGKSDSFLNNKIKSTAHKIVGEEIRKYAKVLNQEIQKEFENMESNLFLSIEKNIQHVEQTLYSSLNSEKKDFKILEEELHKKINILLETITFKLKEVEEKIEESVKKEVEKRMESLSLKNLNIIEEKIENIPEEIEIVKETKDKVIFNDNAFFNNKKTIENNSLKEVENKIKEKQEQDLKTLENKKNINQTLEEVQKKEDFLDYITKDNFIKTNYQKIINKFKDEKFLFSENVYKNKFKNINAEEFLNFKDNFFYIKEGFVEKMYSILIEFMDSLNIDPNIEESIDDFLKRALELKYFKNKN